MGHVALDVWKDFHSYQFDDIPQTLAAMMLEIFLLDNKWIEN